MRDMILMERPAPLTAEARQEDRMRARRQVQSANQQHGLPDSPNGYTANNSPRARAATFVRQAKEAVASEKPNYEY